MNETSHHSPFEQIRKVSEEGTEYWSARDLAKILGYTQYNKFTNVIERAEEACRNSGQSVENHFTHTSEMVEIGSGAKRKFNTVLLSRYACYLIIQNSDPTKPIVALGQTYFTVQTRRQEIADELALMSEDELRLLRRSQMNVYNTQTEAGGTMPEDLPTPEKSIQELQRDEQRRLEQKRQPSLFDDPDSSE